MPHLRSIPYGPLPLQVPGSRRTTRCCGRACRIREPRGCCGRAHIRRCREFLPACKTGRRSPARAAWEICGFPRGIPDYRKDASENIHLHGFHSIQIAFDDVERDEMPAGVDHQSTPREARAVFDVQSRNAETFRRDGDQLEKRLQAAECAERIGGVQPCPGGRHIELVGFILAKFLNGLAFAIRGDFERCWSRALVRMKNEQPGLPLNLPLEAQPGMFKARLAVTGKRDAETRVDFQRAISALELRRQRHDVQRCIRLRV